MYITKDTGDIYVDTASSNIIWNETVNLTFLETDTYDYKSNMSSNELVVSDDYEYIVVWDGIAYKGLKAFNDNWGYPTIGKEYNKTTEDIPFSIGKTYSNKFYVSSYVEGSHTIQLIKESTNIKSRIQLNADKAYKLKNSDDTLLSIGNEKTPVYFKDGIPKTCGSINSEHIETADDNEYPILFSLSEENEIGKNTNVYIKPSEGAVIGNKVYGAVWNDYAEYRETIEEIEPGRVVCENGDDTLSLSSLRLEPGANIVSDTFGFAIGKTEKSKTPIAVSGRVLAYPWEDRNSFYPGEPVCSGPNGTVSKMSREEIMIYPERIIGTVSAIPEYETWGPENIEVKGRIWIKVR